MTKNICITFTQKSKIILPYVVAHEMFHNIQMNKYDMPGVIARRWWMEATADYAGSRLAIDAYPNMGKTDQGPMPLRFLATPLESATIPRAENPRETPEENAARLHAYQSAHFLEYLCKTGAALKRASDPGITAPKYFKQMWDFVSSNGVYTLSSLDSFLIKEHGKSYALPWQYERFALNYLFDTESAMVPGMVSRRTSGFPREACEDRLILHDTDTELPTYTFSLEGGYTAKVLGVLAKTAKPGQTLGVSVELEGTLPASTSVHVVHLPRNNRRPGGVPPIGSFEFPADSRKIFIANLMGEYLPEKGDVKAAEDEEPSEKPAERDALYVVAVNTYFSAQTINVKIRQCPLKIDSITPPTTRPYAPIIITGRGFGSQQPTNRAEGLFYGTQRVYVGPASATTRPWTDTEIRTTAPTPPGDKFTVKINGMTSNAFPFTPDLGPWPPGDLEVRAWTVRLRNHKINLTWYLSLQVFEGGVVHCYNGGPGGPTTRPLLGQGTVKPNLAGEKGAGLYIWNIPFVYTYWDHPIVNGERTLYTVSGVITANQITGTVTGGAMTSKPAPSGRRIIDIGKPVEPSAIPTQPANQADLSDEVWNVYNNEFAWCRVQGSLDSINRQIKDYQQQLDEVGKFSPAPPPGGDAAALRTVIKLLEQAITVAGKEFNEVTTKTWQAHDRLGTLQANRLFPSAMPYDRAKADLVEMDKQLRAQQAAKEAEFTDKRKQFADLQTRLDKACREKIPAGTTATDELSQLRAEANRRQAELDLTKLRTAGRQKHLDELARQLKEEQTAADALAAAIKARPADAGVPFQTMVIILPYNQRK